MYAEKPAGFVWRLGARAIDFVVFGWLVILVLIEIDQRLLGGDPLGQKPVRLVFDSGRPVVLLLVLVVLYEVIPLGVWGATPGKALLGTRVQTVASIPGSVMASGRAAVLYLPVIFLGVFGLLILLALLISVFVAADGRGLHDRLLGTLVVSLPRDEEAR